METPSPYDETDLADKFPIKDKSPADPDRDDVADSQLGPHEGTRTSTPSTGRSVSPTPVQDQNRERNSDSKVAEDLQFGDDAAIDGRKAEQSVVSPSSSTHVDTGSDAANSSMFLWTPQPERRSTSPGDDAAFDRTSFFNRSERTRRSARLRGFMLQSLDQGMAGMMQEIASEGRGGLWTPQENRRRIEQRRPERKTKTALTDRRGSDSRDQELILESHSQSAAPVNTAQKTDNRNTPTREDMRTSVSKLRADNLTVFRFEGTDTGQPTLSPEKAMKPFRRSSGGARSPGHPQKKAVDLQAVQAREELKRLSRGGSTSNSPESGVLGAETGTRGSRETTPTARVTPNNHVQRLCAGGTYDQSTEDKRSPHVNAIISVKNTQPMCSVSDGNVVGIQSAPQVQT